MDQEILKVFFYDVRYVVVMHFSAWAQFTKMLLAWPPRSPDATPCDFFLWGYVKDQVYVPPLPASIPELKVQIRTAIDTITADRLQTVWNELDFHVDVCRITGCAHRAPVRYVTKICECCSIK